MADNDRPLDMLVRSCNDMKTIKVDASVVDFLEKSEKLLILLRFSDFDLFLLSRE